MLNEIKNNILDVIKSCDTVQFCTFKENGDYPETRTLANMINQNECNANDLILYFFTNKNSHKIQQVKNNNNVCLYYLNPETRRALTLFGKTDVIFGLNEKIKFWRDEWKKFGYVGKDDENYCIIKFTPKIYKYYINKTEEITGNL